MHQAVEREFGQRKMSRAVLPRFGEELGQRHPGADTDGDRIVVIEDYISALIRLFPLTPALKRFDRSGCPDDDEAEVEQRRETHGRGSG